MDAAQYLRKSRMEEGMETEKVLSRHRKAIADFAARSGIHIIATYEEIVSGESLYARPEMLRLLKDVEDGCYDAVLCMDLDRLSRGRMRDQGVILDTFKDSGTLIITPEKTYNLADELDDELAEFKTFLSRREYKIITKRLRRGLQQSIQDGCYVANAPYGYRKVTVDKRPTLEIYEPEAQFVRMMFRLYADGYGCVSIADHINLLGARPHRSAEFSRSSVAAILRNPTYIGKVVWNQKTHIRKGSRGNDKHITIYNPRDRWTITDGLHPAIVEKELFDTVQTILAGRYRPPKQDGRIKSTMAGLIRCAGCGKNMQRLNMKGGAYLVCTKTDCCAGAKYDLVEARLLRHLKDVLEELTVSPEPARASAGEADCKAMLASVRREWKTAENRKSRLYELLEMGEYDLPTFRERMAAVREKLVRLEDKEAEIISAMEHAREADPSPQARKLTAVLDAYDSADVPQRNALLHSIIDHVVYTKPKKTRPAAFSLQVFLKPY